MNIELFRWLPSITTLINNISSSFTNFMERLGCAGEVRLVHDDDEVSESSQCIFLLTGGNCGDSNPQDILKRKYRLSARKKIKLFLQY